MTGRPLGPLTWSLSVGRGAGLWAGALGGGTDVRRTCLVPGTQPSSSLASGCQKERPPCLSPLSLLSTSSSGPGAVPAPGSRPGGGSTSGEGRIRQTPALHVIPWLTPHHTALPGPPSPAHSPASSFIPSSLLDTVSQQRQAARGLGSMRKCLHRARVEVTKLISLTLRPLGQRYFPSPGAQGWLLH